MTLTEYAEVIGSRVDIVGHCMGGLAPKAQCCWVIRIDGVEVVDGHLLASVCGRGSTPRKAAAEYVKKIAGKPILRRHYDKPDLRTTVLDSLKPF